VLTFYIDFEKDIAINRVSGEVKSVTGQSSNTFHQ